MDESTVIEVIKVLDLLITKADEINKRIVTAIVIITALFCITLSVIAGFYFLGYTDYQEGSATNEYMECREKDTIQTTEAPETTETAKVKGD
ncbi:MAG: hypothetical protein GX660_02830 [Clostridiaceae bacterium]|jgi:hypothetical protein|nr:hypothetical protein [Clostridiaceae bacterium]